MATSPRIDIVHTSPVVTAALCRELRHGSPPVRVDTAVHSWVDFQSRWDFAGGAVVVDAFLDDHVPLPLKLRALRRLGTRPIVLGPARETPFARRCGAEGAVAWIEPTHGVAATTQAIRMAAAGSPAEQTRIDPAAAPVAPLADRVLQVAALHVSTRGHSPAHLGRVLSLHTESVRRYIERARAPYRAAGHPTRTRGALQTALVADGWVLDPAIWVASGRE